MLSPGVGSFCRHPDFFPIMKSRRTLHLTACVLVATAVVAIYMIQKERRTPVTSDGLFASSSSNPLSSTATTVRHELRSSNRPASARPQEQFHERKRLAEQGTAQPATAGRPARSTPLWQQWHRRQSTPQGTLAAAAKTAIHHPAVWVDLGDQSMLTFSQQADLQVAAESLQQRLAESNLALDSDDYRARWQAEVEQSDQLFRQRYGGYAWHRHHVQAYHLDSGNPTSTR